MWRKDKRRKVVCYKLIAADLRKTCVQLAENLRELQLNTQCLGSN